MLINYVNTLQSSDEALIMFVQIGDEAEAYDWLKTGLDEGLRAKFDVIYTVTFEESATSCRCWRCSRTPWPKTSKDTHGPRNHGASQKRTR